MSRTFELLEDGRPIHRADHLADMIMILTDRLSRERSGSRVHPVPGGLVVIDCVRSGPLQPIADDESDVWFDGYREFGGES